jgi:ABC-type cobalamin/Fe3+-siderophores transport system ATPase subunit
MPSEKELKYGDSANDKITFLTKNASIIGANGSGKSSLMRKFKELNSNFTTISAHKNLTIKQGQHRAQDDDWLNQHKSFYDSPIT